MKMYQSIFLILEDIKQDIIDQYEQKGIKASGKLERNMKIQRRGRIVSLTMPYYSQFISIFKGRKPGRPPGGDYKKIIPIIVQWMKDKGIQPRDALRRFLSKSETNYRRSAGAIAHKITTEGTDIYKGKRQAIDIDQIINNRLDYRGNELADRILEDLRV
jgi:hypothetical protein